MHQGIPLPVQGVRVVASGVPYPVKRRQGIVVPAEVFEDVRFHRAGGDVMRLFRKNYIKATIGLVIPAETDECDAALEQRGGVSRVGLEELFEVLLRLRIAPEVEQRNPPAVQDDLVSGIDTRRLLLPGTPRPVSLEERKVGAAPDPLHPGHRLVLEHPVERPDRLGVLAEAEERHAAGVPHLALTLIVLQDLVETFDRPIVAAECIVDQPHGVPDRDMIRIGEGDLIKAFHRAGIVSSPEEE
ncbi:hypothetical protein DSECCO2_607060 [anaerobic digester metagenome]